MLQVWVYLIFYLPDTLNEKFWRCQHESMKGGLYISKMDKFIKHDYR